MPPDDSVDRVLMCVDSVLTCVDSVDVTPEIVVYVLCRDFGCNRRLLQYRVL